MYYNEGVSPNKENMSKHSLDLILSELLNYRILTKYEPQTSSSSNSSDSKVLKT